LPATGGASALIVKARKMAQEEKPAGSAVKDT